MKKFMMAAMALLIAISGAMAQPKTNDKALWKQAQKKAKEFKKEGWKVDGSKTLEAYLYEHYVSLRDNEQNQELMGQVVGETNCQTRQAGQSYATTNASNLYAKQAREMVKGKIDNDMGVTKKGLSSPESFYEAYETRVATELQGELKASFRLFREKGEGYIDYQIFFLVNEDEASKARLRAMENAMLESEFARNNAERISEFVRKGFAIEQ